MTSTETPTRPQPAVPQKRRKGRRAVVALLFIAVALVFAAIASLKWTEAQIERIPEEELTALATPVAGGPRNILLVGTDSRDNIPDDFNNVFGDFSGSRTDTIMIVHMVPGQGAQLLSIPRDLKVKIAGRPDNRINAAFAFGGADLLIETIEANLGIPIHNYVEIGFGGFAQLVDSLGGVTMEFPYDAKDNKSGFAISAGSHRLDGEQAIAFARSRHYKECRRGPGQCEPGADGKWKSVGGGDIGRTKRQQALLLAIFDGAATASAFDVARFGTTFAGLIRADAGLTTGVIIELGRAGLSLDRGDIAAMTLPVRLKKEKRAYVVPKEPDATAVIDAFIKGEPFPEL